MPYVLGITKVKDVAKWKAGFGGPEGAAMRKAAGVKSQRAFCSDDDPNTVVTLIEWNHLDDARKYYQSDKWKQKQPIVGVIGMPEIYFLEEIEQQSV